MTSLRDRIVEEAERAVRKLRIGFYTASVEAPDTDVEKGDGRRFTRATVRATWGATLRNVRRVTSPIMDVTPAQGARVVILSEDGNPAFGAIVGQVFDEDATIETMQAWIRSNQQKDPRFLEIGAEEVLRFRVGPNKHAGTERGEVDAADALIEIRNGRISIQGMDVEINGYTLRLNGRHVVNGGRRTI